MTTVRTRWREVLAEAAEIVRSYDTGVTLRQLFYRLVAKGLLANTRSGYSVLSRTSARARREGAFPALIDRTRAIHRWQTFDGVAEARVWLASIYRRDRTTGQAWSVYVGVEKAGLVELLRSWFDALGLPVVALGGYASQTYVDEIAEDVRRQGRPAVLIYAGDFDPSGEDIARDFLERAGCFDRMIRVALNEEQVREFDLPPMPGKATDSRAGAFTARHGKLVQVELDALPPDVLHGLYGDAVSEYVDMSTYDAVVQREAAERDVLERATLPDIEAP